MNACSLNLKVKLLSNDRHQRDYFGETLAISGSNIIVGAWGDSDNAVQSGAAYMFRSSNGMWLQQAKLVPADGSESRRFGWSVDVFDDTAIIGAPYPGTPWSPGAVYIYIYMGTWQLQEKLISSDAYPGDMFGYSVALGINTAVIGSLSPYQGLNNGCVYVFVRSNNTWSQQAKLVADDAQANDHFGASVALANDSILVGSPHHYDDVNYFHHGAAYIFVRDGSNQWTQQLKIVPDDKVRTGFFGSSVALSYDTAIIGCGGCSSAYVYNRDENSEWGEPTKLVPDVAFSSLSYGNSVALDNDYALVSEPTSENGGLVYLFVRIQNVWTQSAAFHASDVEFNDWFGSGVALQNNLVVVGSRQDDDHGSAYVFDSFCSVTSPRSNHVTMSSVSVNFCQKLQKL